MPWDAFEPYSTPQRAPSSTSPYNVPLSSAEQSRKEAKADIPKNIGFRGRHNHGKGQDDPVYPTRPIPPQLRPKTLVDWRTAGRAMLVAGLAALGSGTKLRSRKAILDWQKQGLCSARCGYECAKEKRRIFCEMRVPMTVHDHFARMDGMLRTFKGFVRLDQAPNTRVDKPIHTTMRKVAERNSESSVLYKFHGGLLTKGRRTRNFEGNSRLGAYDAKSDPEYATPDEELHDPKSKAELDMYLEISSR